MLKIRITALLLLTALIISCSDTKQPSTNIENDTSSKPEFEVNYEKFVLDNGLEVVFHIDRSDPVVAVNLTAHVGSAREIAGRTGFAHLFEHLLFLESENLGKGGLDRLSANIGGSGANGSTSRDRTNYLQTVPKDALEKMLWAEADKLGWFINTVTTEVLEKEKQVVKNEKRQSNDNRPYGHNWFVIDKNMYPEDHPYNWQVIGSLDDLQAATLDDVKKFFKRWYVPNNVTLTLAGDFDPKQAKLWVEKYFSEIASGEEIKPLKKQAAVLSETKKLYHEDNFAKLPQLTRVYPTVPQYGADQYALDVLLEYLTDGKSAPLYKVIVEDKQFAPQVSAFQQNSELAGQLYMFVRGYPNQSLSEINQAIDEAFAMFEKEGMSESDLTRILASQETNFYNGLSSVLGKGAQLAYYNIYTGDPGYVKTEIDAILSVSLDDVKRVYNTYIKNKHYVATSFVPKQQLALVLEGSTKATVVEEKVVQGAEESIDPTIASTYIPTPSSFDRSEEPSYGKPAEATVPEIWQANAGKINVLGIESTEVPLVDFELVIDGGKLLENPNKVGISNILAQMLSSGTKNKSPEALEKAIKQIGATITIRANQEDIRFQVNTLSKNYEAAIKLVNEMLLEPRWDEQEFSLIKQQTLAQISQQAASPTSIAANAFSGLVYGKDSIRAQNILGTKDSVNAITMSDVKQYYAANIAPSLARIHVVGDVNRSEVLASLSYLEENWLVPKPSVPSITNTLSENNRIDAALLAPKKSVVYFYNVAGAKQTVVNIGYPALAATNEDFYPATVMNYMLGGGSFVSKLTQSLRETKGYTYGIRSGFRGTLSPGQFVISSNVRSNVTLEAAQTIKEIIDDYANIYSESDLLTTQNALIKSNARAFETANAKLNLLNNISKYNWSHDYVKQRENIVNNMSVDKIKTLAKTYLNTNNMIWLFVGDAETQLPRMNALGFGEPVLLNPNTKAL